MRFWDGSWELDGWTKRGGGVGFDGMACRKGKGLRRKWVKRRRKERLISKDEVGRKMR